jgi:heme oxygenase
LRKLLKEKTKTVHREEENVGVVRDCVKSQGGRAEYRQLVARLYHTYKALETEWDRICTSCSDTDKESRARLRTLWFPDVVARTTTLEQDLAFYYGPDWRQARDVVEMSPATKEYVDRIVHVAQRDPLLLVAHAYTRYLGDLSGGQILMRVAKKAMNLPEDGAGTEFYRFPKIDNAKQFKNMYRERLDGLALDESDQNRVCEEAIKAFRFNINLFVEMDQICGTSDLAGPYHKREEEENESKKATKSSQCPFALLASQAGKSDPKNNNNNNVVAADMATWLAALLAFCAIFWAIKVQ